MQRNIALTIEYDGTRYAGWQIQNHSPNFYRQLNRRQKKQKTIQEAIEQVLGTILQEDVRLIGSGRTDAGVHAEAQVANFKTSNSISLKKIFLALNGLLADDIVIKRIQEVPLSFNSRFNAISKVYRYSILNRKYPSALLSDHLYFFPYPLDIGLMQRQARFLVGMHDFKCFQAKDKVEKNTVRTIKKVRIAKKNSLIYIDIEADGFLRHMVRNIVGTLIEIGRGRNLDIRELIYFRDRTKAGPTAPAKGLCLVKVKY